KPPSLSRALLYPVLVHLPAQRVPMQAGHAGGFADVVVRFGERAGDEDTLELALGVVEEDAAVDHLLDEGRQVVAHHHCRSFPVSSRYASMYFARVRWTTSSGSEGTGGCLFQPICSR